MQSRRLAAAPTDTEPAKQQDDNDNDQDEGEGHTHLYPAALRLKRLFAGHFLPVQADS
ncbi:hypothetical protein BH10ACT2_BH10ACT2_28710 [soil metagenome]